MKGGSVNGAEKGGFMAGEGFEVGKRGKLLNCTSQEKPPLLQGRFFIAEQVVL